MEHVRSEIKHNFLKKLVFRLDYDGILESDAEDCVSRLRNMLHDLGFINFGSRIENQVDLQVKMDLNIPNQNEFSISNTNKSLVYVFAKEGNKEILEISKTFCTFTVDIENVCQTFGRYMDLLTTVINEIKNTSPYFRANRIGLRKINICFLHDLRTLSAYFTNAAFNFDDLVSRFSDFECTASNSVTILLKDGFQINYVRNIQQGMMQQEDGNQSSIYQVVLDIDVYNENNREILAMLSDTGRIKEMLTNQNTIEFETFYLSLTDEFIEKLKQDEFNDSVIKGVV